MKLTCQSVLLLLLVCFFVSCQHKNSCKETLVFEYDNDNGHYFGFEPRVVHRVGENSTVKMAAKKNLDDSTSVILGIGSRSNTLHFEKEEGGSTKLHIQFGKSSYSVGHSIYTSKTDDYTDEDVSYRIPMSVLKSIVEQSENKPVEFSVADYKFSIDDDMKCCLKQLYESKK